MSYLEMTRERISLPFVFGLVTAFIFGSIIGLGQTGAIIVFYCICMLYAALFLAYRKTKSVFWVFLIVWLPIFIGPLLFRITRLDIFPVWQVVLMLLPLFGLVNFWKALAGNYGLKWWFIFSVVFLLLGILSSVFGRSGIIAGIYQLISDLKPMLLLIIGFSFRNDPRVDSVIWFSVRWLWLPMLLFIAWEWLSPATYFSLLQGGPKLSDPSPLSFIPTRAFGFFEHPGMMASLAATLCILSMGAVMKNIDRHKNIILSLGYVAIIICSTQRQELFSLIFSIYIMYLIFSKPKELLWRLIASSCVAAVFLLLFIFANMENLEREIALWGGESGAKIESPRSQLFAGAITIADNYFPFGSGLGTYGGAGSKKFDWSLYDDLGFGRYWWYGKENYLMDTYWPNPVAEAGYLGALMLLASYLMLFIIPWRKARNAIRVGLPTSYTVEASALVIYILLLSISSPAFQDPRLFVFPVILIGYSLMTMVGGKTNEKN